MIAFDQRIRLLREDPWDASSLAEEIYTMFSADIPLQVDTGIEVGNKNGGPLIAARDYSDGDTIFSIGKKGGGTYTVTIESGDLVVGDDGADGEDGSPGGSSSGGGGRSTGSNCFPGQVVSGSDSEYLVNIYPDGTGADPELVSVTQLQINAGQIIPAGTWALVSQTTDGSYFMQVAVWL